MLPGLMGGAAKHIDPRGLRRHFIRKVRVFDELLSFTGRPEVLHEVCRARGAAFVQAEPLRPVTEEYEPDRGFLDSLLGDRQGGCVVLHPALHAAR